MRKIQRPVSSSKPQGFEPSAPSYLIYGLKVAAHPLHRFPLWYRRIDGKVFTLIDRHVPALLDLARRQCYPQITHIGEILVHALVMLLWVPDVVELAQHGIVSRENLGPDRIPDGEVGLFFGFHDMPPEVARTLRLGRDMSALRRLCGWQRIEFYDDRLHVAYARGVDGSEYWYSEDGEVWSLHESDAWTPGRGRPAWAHRADES